MPITEQKIMNFYQVAQARDFTRNFQFRVNQILDRGAPVVTPEDLLYVTAAQLPAREVNNITVPYMGLTFNVPGAATYPGSGGYTLTFRSDSEQIIRRVFENWQRSIFDDQTSAGTYKIFSTSRVVLDLLNQNFATSRQYVLHGVWPQSVGAMSYALDGDGSVLTFDVTIAYQFWTRGITQ